MSNMNLFFFGGGIGLTVAIVGAIADYWLHLRPGKQLPKPGASRQPGCILFAVGGLMLTGIVAIIGSLFITGDIWPAVILGLGTFVGFYLGFVVLLVIWLQVDKQTENIIDEKPNASGLQQDLERTE